MAITEFPEIRIFMRVLYMSKAALLFLLLFVIGAGLMAVIVIFFAETSGCVVDIPNKIWVLKDDPSQVCSFQSAGDATWLVMVTMTTVGYGDFSPKTVIGKVIMAFLMLVSVVGFSLPVAIFGANLTELYMEQRLSKREKSRAASPQIISSTSLDQSVIYDEKLGSSIEQMVTRVSGSLQKMQDLEHKIEDIVSKLKSD